MPVGQCSNNGKPGYKWGDSGKCYTYTAGDSKSQKKAKQKAQMQGLAARLGGYMEKETVTSGGMESGIKNPQQGYPRKKKKKKIMIEKSDEIADDIIKSLTEWFREKWVDLSRPKPGGGFEPCGRPDASSGKYPKCVPASRAARMSQAEIDSAVRRKRRAESTQNRQDKKPIYVSTEKREVSAKERERLASRGAAMPDGSYPIATVQDLRNAIQSFGRAKNPAAVKRHIIRRARALGATSELPESWGYKEEMQKRNVPTNPTLYARVKAEAKRKFDVYPSAYANAWLVREYKRRGGGYRVVNKMADDLMEEEAVLAQALVAIAEKYGKFDEDGIGIWAGYEPAEENDDAEIGVKCKNCVLYAGNGICKILATQVEDDGKCRFAIIPDDLVQMEPEDNEMEDEMEDEMENSENGEEEDGEMEEVELNLKPRQQMHYEVLESVAEKYGKWDQTSGANGAHYAPAAANPFKEQGMVCANCIFYEGGRGCEIVSGTIEPEAICKLWIIDESLISESE